MRFFVILQLLLFAPSFLKAQIVNGDNVEYYICPETLYSTVIYTGEMADDSDDICGSGTRLVIKVIGGSDLVEVPPKVTRIDIGDQGHYAQLNVQWKPGALGTLTVNVYYKKNYFKRFRCRWSDDRYMYTYVLRHEPRNPSGSFDGTKSAGVINNDSEVAFNLTYLPSATYPAYLKATKIKYDNGRGEEITTDIVKSGSSYLSTPVTYYAKGIGEHFLNTQVLTVDNFECSKWYTLPAQSVRLYSSCYQDDFSQVIITPAGTGVSAYEDGSFGLDLNQSYTLNVSGITDFSSHYTWDFSDFGSNVVRNGDSFTPTKIGSYRVTAVANVAGCPVPKAVELLVGVKNMVLDQTCTITLPDDIPQFYPDIDNSDVILKHIAGIVETERSIIVKPGVTLELGAELSLDYEEPTDEEENINFIEQKTYDEYGRVVSESRSYYDDGAALLQTQTKNLSKNIILANSTLYDAYGRAAITTLPAPVHAAQPAACPDDAQTGSQIEFSYKSDFVRGIDDQNTYTYSDFDLANETNPVAIDGSAEGTLGWYYSANNGSGETASFNEPFVARTQYPYSRTLYKQDGSGDVKGVTIPGDIFKSGSPYMATANKEPVAIDDQYLQAYLVIREKEFNFPVPQNIAQEFYKKVAFDEVGKKSVAYLDKSGNTIIALYFGNGSVALTTSYNFYDYTGRILVSVSPNGVNQYQVDANGDSNFDSIDKTKYFYNSEGLLAATEEKTAGLETDGISRTEYIYRKDGKIRFSQNELQRNSTPQRYSYTNYDNAGRAIESGEYVVSGGGVAFDLQALSGILENTDTDGGLSEGSGLKQERAYTSYDVPDPALPVARVQRFLHGAISHTQKDNNITTWYSYDERGRIEWMVQNITYLGVKTLDYRYGPTGAIQDVTYQKGVQAEQFVHHYEYDADGRLYKAYTSREELVYNKLGELLNPQVLALQATYHYYLHGPLKRVELAGNIQGIDYIYTADGKLKGINHANPAQDPGGDGLTNTSFKPDVFGITLDYYTNDYSGRYQASSLSGLGAFDEQYTGIIKATRWHSPVDGHKQFAYAYDYDAQDQFSKATWGSVTGNTFIAQPLEGYKESIGGYDANGNILSLQRNAGANRLNSDNASLAIADFTYHYKANSNILETITQGSETFRSYQYDDLGQMTYEVEGERLKYIVYDVTGKVTGIYADEAHTVPITKFTYDDRGFRLSKTSHDEEGVLKLRTWYVRDASGNVVCTYEDYNEPGKTPQPSEAPIYGSGKIGMYRFGDGIALYELTDHLGNVRAVIGDEIETEYLATMESERMPDEAEDFMNIEPKQGPSYANHTANIVDVDGETFSIANPNEVTRLNNRPNDEVQPDPIGPSIMLWVHPGDVINAEVFAKYTNFDSDNTNLLAGIASFLTTTFSSTAVIDGASVFNVMNSPDFATLSAWAKLDEEQPRAFLTYLLFDNNNKLVDFDFDQVSNDAEVPETIVGHAHERLLLENITIEKEGYIYIYVSNQSDQNMEVYFDDLKVTHRYSNIVSGGDYYPFGLAIKDRHIDRDIYRYKYQGQFAERDDETGWSHFKLREYDPLIARTLTVDPAMQFYSPYVWVDNNPICRVDPTGGVSPIFSAESGTFMGLDKNGWDGPILFMNEKQYQDVGGAQGLRKIDASKLGLTDIRDQSFGSNLQAWSNVITFLLTNKNIPLGLGLNYNRNVSVGMGYVDDKGNDITTADYLGGMFSKNTGMYVDPSNNMTVVINQAGKLEAPIFFGNVWEVINTGVHENDHRGPHWGPAIGNEKRRAELELRAISIQRIHPSWKKVSSSYVEEIQRYKDFNEGKLKQ
jgi:RHS repeat-associated protein